jgi:hypothetical protein
LENLEKFVRGERKGILIIEDKYVKTEKGRNIVAEVISITKEDKKITMVFSKETFNQVNDVEISTIKVLGISKTAMTFFSKLKEKFEDEINIQKYLNNELDKNEVLIEELYQKNLECEAIRKALSRELTTNSDLTKKITILEKEKKENKVYKDSLKISEKLKNEQKMTLQLNSEIKKLKLENKKLSQENTDLKKKLLYYFIAFCAGKKQQNPAKMSGCPGRNVGYPTFLPGPPGNTRHFRLVSMQVDM